MLSKLRDLVAMKHYGLENDATILVLLDTISRQKKYSIDVLGDITEGNALDLFRQDAGLSDEIRQAFILFLPGQSVGVQSDQRTNSHVIVLRAITSQDGTTADWYYFDHKFLVDVVSKICNSVRGANRVCQDVTLKPPTTVEWE